MEAEAQVPELGGHAPQPRTAPQEILVSRCLGETRVAVLEEGLVREIYVERDVEQGVVGNIYRGRVSRVLPGMQAAFVQVGLPRAAFLYVDDVLSPDVPDDETDFEDEPPPPPKDRPSITQLLHEGQEILVQVAKAPLGTKGARVTTYVSIPGRYVVYMPTMERLGVSRRITHDVERKRLKDILEQNRSGEGGYIARTVCEGLDAQTIAQDMAFVRSLWSQVKEKSIRAPVPALLLADLDLVLRSTRDLFGEQVTRLVIDDEREAQRVRDLLGQSAPGLAARVQLYSGATPLFESYGIESELHRALERKIELKSGGSIVIDEAEALTAIDVNTGSFVGSKDLEATILKTNLEAAKEIAHQVRLRNLGGIIIVDFIDMAAQEAQDQVYTLFVAELAKDRAKTHALPMSSFGVVELTRKRVRPSLGKTLTEPCPYCEGRGRVRSRRTLCMDILRELERQARAHPRGMLVVACMPEVATMLTDPETGLSAMEHQLGRPVVVEARGDLHQEIYEVSVRSASTLP